MNDLTEALRGAGIDYRTTPDGTVYVDDPDGGMFVALGEAEAEAGQPSLGGYDAAFYAGRGEDPQRQDWFPTAGAVVEDVRRWLGRTGNWCIGS